MAQVLKDEVKDKILDSAIELFTLNGFKDTSIKEIAGHANVSVGNVYRYFDNKDDLYRTVIQGVYEGVRGIMQEVLVQEKYNMVYEEHLMTKQAFEPMVNFVRLYQKEKKVFDMLMKGEKDRHYEETILIFLQMLRDYFYRYWGEEQHPNGMSYWEVSAFANAVVFAVIDLLNNSEGENIDELLMSFTSRLVKGYFYAKNLEVLER